MSLTYNTRQCDESYLNSPLAFASRLRAHLAKMPSTPGWPEPTAEGYRDGHACQRILADCLAGMARPRKRCKTRLLDDFGYISVCTLSLVVPKRCLCNLVALPMGYGSCLGSRLVLQTHGKQQRCATCATVTSNIAILVPSAAFKAERSLTNRCCLKSLVLGPLTWTWAWGWDLGLVLGDWAWVFGPGPRAWA